ncbi:hypothetical protein E8E13_000540 [Curvularia kusanoi]|uniref:Uncharacterized protein n=1 Tax=Curvularia kusanoi TaxID=90978 RepID=A0A9P4T7Z3_CURKU|nr:hypothetical protein E8E13_000540 [Curvularia kusanoi]
MASAQLALVAVAGQSITVNTPPSSPVASKDHLPVAEDLTLAVLDSEGRHEQPKEDGPAVPQEGMFDEDEGLPIAEAVDSLHAIEGATITTKEMGTTVHLAESDACNPVESVAVDHVSIPPAGTDEPRQSQPSTPVRHDSPAAVREEVHVTAETRSQTEETTEDERNSDDQGKLRGDGNAPARIPPKQSSTPLKTDRKIPPHMGPIARNLLLQQAGWPAPVPRSPPAFAPRPPHTNSRPPFDHEELQRTKAHLIKTRDELDDERKRSSGLRQTIEAEMEASYAAALESTLSELLRKQADTLAAKVKYEQKERDLQYREAKIAQLEVYLTAGQMQLKHSLEERGIRPMSAVDKTNMKSEVELNVKHQYADIEGKIAIQVERIRLQDAAQRVREQQYRALIRLSLERKILEEIQESHNAIDADAKEKGSEDTSCAESSAEESTIQPNRAYLEGYAACHDAQTALYNLQHGKIAANNPGIAFLFDPTHPRNPLIMGLRIGCVKATSDAAAETNTVTVVNGSRAHYNIAEICQSARTSTRSSRFTPQASPTSRTQAQDQKHPNQVSVTNGKFVTEDAVEQVAAAARSSSERGTMDAVGGKVAHQHGEQPEADSPDAKIVKDPVLIDL